SSDLPDALNPSKFKQDVGRVHRAGQKEAETAIQAAWTAFAEWQHTPAEHRAALLFKAAAEMRRRKLDFNAWLVIEVGKSWAEAEADTAEAIDFMEFYGRQALRYAAPQPLTPSPLTDEVNELNYIPLGVGIVIPPWNFPLAIL